jgi:hypothetical protein
VGANTASPLTPTKDGTVQRPDQFKARFQKLLASLWDTIADVGVNVVGGVGVSMTNAPEDVGVNNAAAPQDVGANKRRKDRHRPRKGDRHKPGYMRDYMRRRRAREVK